MAIPGIEQPQKLVIDPTLRLRKVTQDCAFALAWYQDPETLLLVDGDDTPYTMERLLRMYRYLSDRGEAWFIEVKTDAGFEPIGDVTFWQEDLPIVIGPKQWRGRGIGGRVLRALIARGKELGFPCLKVREIYDYNTGSRRLFESVGFRQCRKTAKGASYSLTL